VEGREAANLFGREEGIDRSLRPHVLADRVD
jgi:hypothetical protein